MTYAWLLAMVVSTRPSTRRPRKAAISFLSPLGIVIQAGSEDGNAAHSEASSMRPVDLAAERVGHAGKQQADGLGLAVRYA